MNRRDFLKTGAAAAALAGLEAGLPVAAKAAPSKRTETVPGPSAESIKVRFLGTGAADWNGPDERGEHRRLSSVLINCAFLIDYTGTARDMMPEGIKPEVAFYTHSHGDHYNPLAALELGIRKVYLSETWYDRARKDFREASKKSGIPAPEIIPVKVGGKYFESGIVVTPLPANHATGYLDEQALIYLLTGVSTRLLYATDTGGIMAIASRTGGFDAHLPGEPLTGIIMEATMGLGYEEDYRIFCHSSVATVENIVKVLSATGRYKPGKEGQPVFLTHMARTLHGTQKELEKSLPAPLTAAYDGLEYEF